MESSHNAYISRQVFKLLGRISKGDAAVSCGVLVSAFEALARVAQEQRPRRHQLTAEFRAALEAAGGHQRDVMANVPLFEDGIPWTGVADHVLHRPPFSRRKQANSQPSGAALFRPPRQRFFQFNSNFRQESASSQAYTNTTGFPDDHEKE